MKAFLRIHWSLAPWQWSQIVILRFVRSPPLPPPPLKLSLSISTPMRNKGCHHEYKLKQLWFILQSLLSPPDVSPWISLHVISSLAIPFPVESHLEILSLTDYSLVKSITLPEPVFYWRWISDDELGIVTTSTVYHWSLHGKDSRPSLIFTSHRFRSSKKEIFKIVRVISGECADYQLSSVSWWLVVSLDWFDLFPWPNRAKWSTADVLLEERGLPKCSW